MAASTKNDDDVMSEINITPFVDIVLVLLIILMVTSTQIVKASLKVELPKAASGGEAVSSTLNVVMTPDNKILLDGNEVTEDALAAAVRTGAAQDPKLQAVIAADKSIAYGKVVHIIDLVKFNGVASFALNIERTASPDQGRQ